MIYFVLAFLGLFIFSVCRMVKLNRLCEEDPDNSHIYKRSRVKYIVLAVFSGLCVAVTIWLMCMVIMIVKYM
ncbi:MAG: hypothetical protein MJ153_08150 [Clostridia bacterium]|nr:hypothetical protein [Clostridia bacterium]